MRIILDKKEVEKIILEWIKETLNKDVASVEIDHWGTATWRTKETLQIGGEK